MADHLTDLAARWPSLAARFPDLRIAVAGDLMLDHTAAGQARRLSPEAPVPVLLLEEESFNLGGAANVARNLSALGARVRLAGVVGEDEDGDRLLDLCETASIDATAVVRERERRTTRKTRFATDAQQMLRVDRETPMPLTEAAEAEIVAALDGDRADAVIVSDYAKGVATGRVIRAAFELARRCGGPSVVDPKGTDFSRYTGCTIVTPNGEEAAAATNISVRDPADGMEAGELLLRIVGCRAAVVTHGRQGLSVVTPGASWHLPAHTHDVFDVAGAGDTLVAALTLALAADASLTEAAVLANLAAGLAVQARGVSVVTSDEISCALRTTSLERTAA